MGIANLSDMWKVAHIRHIPIDNLYDLCVSGGSIPGRHDLGSLDQVVGCESYYLHDLARVPWIGYVLHSSCTAYQYSRYGIYR